MRYLPSIRFNGSVSAPVARANASANMDFEQAAHLRDQVVKLRAHYEGSSEEDALANLKKTARKGSSYGVRKRR